MRHGLREWIRTKYGVGKPFRSPTQLSLKAGASKNAVRDMEEAESQALELAQEAAVDRFGPDHRFTASDICKLHRLWHLHSCLPDRRFEVRPSPYYPTLDSVGAA